MDNFQFMIILIILIIYIIILIRKIIYNNKCKKILEKFSSNPTITTYLNSLTKEHQENILSFISTTEGERTLNTTGAIINKLNCKDLEVSNNTFINEATFNKVNNNDEILFDNEVEFNHIVSGNQNFILMGNLEISNNNEENIPIFKDGVIHGNIKTRELKLLIPEINNKDNTKTYEEKGAIVNDNFGLQFYTNEQNTPMMTIPHDTKNAVIFRGTGLAYSNQEVDNSRSRYSFKNNGYGTSAFRTLTRDVMWDKNMIYFGGMSYDEESKRMMIAGNRYDKDKNILAYFPALLATHDGGDDRYLCKKNQTVHIGKCSVDEASINQNSVKNRHFEKRKNNQDDKENNNDK